MSYLYSIQNDVTELLKTELKNRTERSGIAYVDEDKARTTVSYYTIMYMSGEWVPDVTDAKSCVLI